MSMGFDAHVLQGRFFFYEFDRIEDFLKELNAMLNRRDSCDTTKGSFDEDPFNEMKLSIKK